MKKLLCVCVILALMLGAAVTAYAADEGKVTVAATGEAKPGALITVIVTVSESPEVTECQVEPQFDSSLFRLESGQWLTSVTGAQSDDTMVQWFLPTTIDGPLYMFTLQILEDAAPGTVATISCNVSAANGDDPVGYQVVSSASITIDCAHTTYVPVEENRYLHTPGADCSTPNTYYVSCQDCGARGEEVFQGQTKGAHKFDGKVESELYLHESGSCVDPATYYLSCSMCGVKGEEVFQGAVAGEHVYDAKVETEEYIASPGDCQSKREYYFSCSGCGQIGIQTFVSDKKFGVHVYQSSCDTDCDVCGKYQEPIHDLAEEWSADEEGHYFACSQCDEKVDLQAHIPGPEATAEEHQTCTVCDFVLAVSDEHVHEYSSSWKHDEKSHWHECSCGLSKSDLTVHSWVIEDTDRTDMLIKKCDVCGYSEEEPVTDIPGDTKPTYTDPTYPSQNTVVVQKETGGNGLAVVLGILLALSLIANGVLTVLLISGKKKR